MSDAMHSNSNIVTGIKASPTLIDYIRKIFRLIPYYFLSIIRVFFLCIFWCFLIIGYSWYIIHDSNYFDLSEILVDYKTKLFFISSLLGITLVLIIFGIRKYLISSAKNKIFLLFGPQSLILFITPYLGVAFYSNYLNQSNILETTDNTTLTLNASSNNQHNEILISDFVGAIKNSEFINNISAKFNSENNIIHDEAIDINKTSENQESILENQNRKIESKNIVNQFTKNFDFTETAISIFENVEKNVKDSQKHVQKFTQGLVAPEPKKAGTALIMPYDKDSMSLTDFTADNVNDSLIRVLIQNQSPLIAVRVENMKGKIGSWKTKDVKTSAIGVLQVENNETVINPNNISFKLDVSNPLELDLIMQDNGAITDQNTDLRVVFFFEDGKRTYSLVKR